MSNEFKEPHDNRNDFIDAGLGFVVSSGFFLTVFIIFTIIGAIKDFQ